MYLRRFQLMVQLQANQRRVWSQHKKQQPETYPVVANKQQSSPTQKEVKQKSPLVRYQGRITKSGNYAK